MQYQYTAPVTSSYLLRVRLILLYLSAKENAALMTTELFQLNNGKYSV